MFRFTIRDVLWLMVVVGLAIAWWLHAMHLRRKADELTVKTEMLVGAMEEEMHPTFDDRTLRVTGFTKDGNEFETVIQKSNYIGPDGRPLSIKYPHAK